MDGTLAHPEIERAVAQIGTADIVVGLATAGPSTTVGPVARAAGEALRDRLAGYSAAVVHVDPVSGSEAVTQVDEALEAWPRLHLVGSGLPEPRGAGSGWERDDPVRSVLEVGRRLSARAVVLLNSCLTETSPAWLVSLAAPVLKEDVGLVLPVYTRGRHEGTLTRALVSPTFRALWGRRFAHPVAEEFGCSGPAADLFLGQDLWGTEVGRQGIEFWLPVVAVESGLGVAQASIGSRRVLAPAPAAPLGPTVGRVASVLFDLAERGEGYWLDREGSETVPLLGPPLEVVDESTSATPSRLLDGFRQGIRDLYAIWERVLAPETLGELLALGELPTEEFRIPDRLWARVVYDFLLGYHFRVVYRSHAAQSLAPLYLAWVASAMLETRGQPARVAAAVADRVGAVFEEQKPYLVARWH
jgi:hypothetical protein